MILDNIKELIKDIEIILKKDERFKKDMFFKNMVKTIYNSNKNNNQMTSYDITPIVLSNLNKLGKNTENINKYKEPKNCKEPENSKEPEKCNCENYKKLITVLIGKVQNAKHDADNIGTTMIDYKSGTTLIDPELLSKIDKAEKENDFDNALELANKI